MKTYTLQMIAIKENLNNIKKIILPILVIIFSVEYLDASDFELPYYVPPNYYNPLFENNRNTEVLNSQESPTYCVPNYSFIEPLSNYIYGVELGCIQNVGTENYLGPNYSDHTNISTILQAGISTTITLYSASAAGINVSSTWADVWIDYDNNGVFSSNESLAQYHFTYSSPASVTLPVFITDNGSYGERRLRVRYTSGYLAGACGSNSCGEAEDYTVFIVDSGIDSQEVGCKNSQVLFQSTEDLTGMTNYEWSAEGNPSIYPNQNSWWVAYGWSEPGIYNVTLEITLANGCTETYIESIEISEAVLEITGADIVCEGEIIQLHAISDAVDGSYTWTGDEITSSSSAASITINTTNLAAGIHSYCLDFTNDGNCSETKCKDVEILPKPAIGITGPDVICHGDSGNLFAASIDNGTYVWSGQGITGNEDSAEVNTTSLTPGVYTYTATLFGNNGCIGTESKTITVISNPVAEICEPTTTVLTCIDDLITLNATCSVVNANNIGYSWSGPNGNLGTSSSQSVTEAGVYTVVVTDLPNGCTHSDNIEITGVPAPEVEIYHTGYHCEGDDVSLLAYSDFGGDYLWSGPGITVNNENDNPVYPPILAIGSHIYTVVYTDEYGCTATDAMEIVIVKAPDAGIGSSFSVCSSGNTTGNLSGALGGTPDAGVWEDTDNSGVDLSDPTNVDFSGLPASNYTFTFIVEGEHSCEDAISEVVVHVFSVDAGINGAAEICNSGNTALNLFGELGGTPDVGGIWEDTDNSGVDLANSANVDFTGVPVGNYIFTYTIIGTAPCVNVSSEVAVNVLSTTVEITTVPNSICEEESLELSASSPDGGNNYLWTGYGVTSNNSSGNPLTLNDLPVGVHDYTVTYTNGNGCTAVDSKTITVVEAPIPGPSGIINICKGESPIFDLTNLSGNLLDLAGAWTDPYNTGIDLTNLASVDFTTIPDGTYTFIYSVEGTPPCQDAISQIVVNVYSVDAGENGNTDVCNNGDTVDLPSILTGTPDIGGTWDDTDNTGVNLNDPTNVSFAGVPAGSYTFIYTATGTFPCGTDTSAVIVNVSEIVSDFCFEINGTTITISNNSTGSAALSYFWDFGDGTTSTDENPIHSYTASTNTETYEICLKVTFEDGTTCCYTCCKEITIYPPCQDNIPGPTFNYLFKNNGYVKFNNPEGVGNAYTKEWTIDGVFHSDVNQAPAKILSSGTHKVCLTVTKNSNPNCSETFCRDILVNNPCNIPETAEFSYETCLDSKTFLFESLVVGGKAGDVIDWDFGDGNTATGNIGEYTYSNYGSYMVCMNVTNKDNCSKKICGVIEVMEPSCTDNCPSSTAVAKVISNTVPKNELIDEINGGTELQIIPNPASNMVKAVFSEIQSDKATITLSDINGKVLTQKSMQKGDRNYEFDISNLPAGVYIMTLEQSDGKRVSSKIMKI